MTSPVYLKWQPINPTTKYMFHSMELYNADTGRLLCAHYPEYGQTHQVHQAWSLSQIIIYITGVWWARLPCYPALSLGFSRGVSPVRMNQFTEILHLSAISRSLFTTNYHVTVLLARRVWCHRCSFLSTQTSPQSKGWPGPPSIIHRFHVYHPYRHSLPHDHDPCSPGTTTRGATTARWPPGRWGACWPSFQLKSETEM